MCRLLGMVSVQERDLGYWLIDARNALRDQAPKHPHGWGIAAFAAGAWTLVRAPRPAHEDEQFVRHARAARGTEFLAHIRNASRGGQTLVNTHPFLRRGWAFGHNGTIQNASELLTRVASDVRPNGETDSEVLFCLILTALREACPDYPSVPPAVACRCLADLAPLVEGKDGTSFLLSDGLRLYAYRDSKPLKWLQPEGAVPPMALVASEAIGDEEWADLPDGEVVLVDRSLEVRSSAEIADTERLNDYEGTGN